MDITYDEFNHLMKFVEMILQMDYCVRVLYGKSVRREDSMIEDMKEEFNGLMNLLASTTFVSV